MFYVNMNDKFMSGWGRASRGKSVYCVECDTLDQAEAVFKAAEDRPEMKYITIAEKPRRLTGPGHRKIVHVSKLGGPWLRYMPRWVRENMQQVAD